MEGILQLTSEQSELLIPEKSGELLVSIEKKQKFIDKINKIDLEMSGLEEIISTETTLVPSGGSAGPVQEERKILEAQRAEIKVLLEEIQKLDGQNRQRVTTAFQRIKKDMECIRLRKGPVKAYQGSIAQTGGCFIDKKK